MSSSSSSEVSLAPAGVDDRFLRRFESSFVGGMEPVLEAMGVGRAELEQTMRETGEIRTVLVGEEDVGSVWLELRERTLHLHALVLDPGARGSGIGGRVLAQLEQEFRDRADELELGVQRGNEAARRLYEKTGFIEVESPHAEPGFKILRRRLGA
ncbi:MAG TPA: GNAT family N-acetyltransferase [Gaiellaceae bacterium]|nr:GNAT family N-acetyltransferase [Gaiellaceae bacterium]